MKKDKQMKLLADFHVHSIASGHAFNTVDELARTAGKKGLKYLAITDHGPAMPGGPHEYYFYNLKVLPEKMYGVKLLKGIEANVISQEGKLDLENTYLKRMDVVIASFHAVVTPEKLSKAENTQMLLKVLENEHVDVLGHIENPEFPVNIKEVVGAAKETGKIIEINNASFTVARKGSRDTCLEIIRELKAQDMIVMINSDAHISHLLGEVSVAWQVARELGLKQQNVINFSKELTEKFVRQRRDKL